MTRGLAIVHAALAVALCAALGTAAAAGPQKKNPSWSDLTAEQQQILAPLAPPEWDQLNNSRKANWLGIANRYPKMSPTEQRRVQSRMQKWVKLTPEQRRQARETYKQIGKLPPEKKKNLHQQWSEYQTLPPHEKSSLAAPPAEDKSAERRRRAKPDAGKSPSSAAKSPAAQQPARPQATPVSQ